MMDICVKNVSAGYGKRRVLDHVSVSFASNQLTGIIGPNGSGKSTLLKCIYRILKPAEGEICLGEQNIQQLSYRESATKIAVLAQHHTGGFDFSVEEVVLLGRTPYKGITEGNTKRDKEIALHAMKETGVDSMADRRYSLLSGGEQQRVMLARALTQETPCLILDEPTNHLDITYQIQIMDLVSTRNLTVVAAIHDLNMAALYCDKLVAMQNGQVIAEGSPAEILTPQRIWDLYHVKAKVWDRGNGRPAIIFERGESV